LLKVRVKNPLAIDVGILGSSAKLYADGAEVAELNIVEAPRDLRAGESAELLFSLKLTPEVSSTLTSWIQSGGKLTASIDLGLSVGEHKHTLNLQLPVELRPEDLVGYAR